MTLRRWRRAVALAFAIGICILRYWMARWRGPLTLARRALWLQESSRRTLAWLGIRYTVTGAPPACGLVLANHLSYLDIAILSAAMPGSFVAKAEVSRWPIFGRAARRGGTLFLDRASLASANRVADTIARRLELPVPVVLFPEGTSTDGARVLRFHSRLLQPAVQAVAPITAAAVRYFAEDASGGEVAERELCWFGDAEFIPHLWKVLGIRRVRAVLRFGQPQVYADRRSAAERTHAQIVAMRAASKVAAL